VNSTMEVSRLLAQNGAPHGTVIAADFQEAGRGRTPERRWEMEREQALAFTVLLRFPHLIPAALTLRTGLAVALAIEDFAPTIAGKALIKWPNDILLRVSDDRQTVLKLAGILAEAQSGNVHIGIGVNVSQKQMPDFLREKATSISLVSGVEFSAGDRYNLLEKILSRLRDEIDPARDIVGDAAAGKLPGWRERLEARLYKKGDQICFAKGAADLVTGTLTGIGPDGELLILPPGETGIMSFTAGEILQIK